jgi:pre-mRNA 3'-end-processing factor FIP1
MFNLHEHYVSLIRLSQEQNQIAQQMYPGMEVSGSTPAPGAGRGATPVPFRGRGMPRGRGSGFQGRGRGRGGIYAGGADGGTFDYLPYAG